MLNCCTECFAKQLKIDKLTEENQRLKAKLHYRDRAQEEGFFGSATPSAKLPVKANTHAPRQPKKRGAVPGHVAHTRKAPDQKTADRVVAVPSMCQGICPHCGGTMKRQDTRRRLVRESRPVVSEEIVLELPVERCCKCRHTVYTKAPGVLPKAVLGNQLLSNAVEMVYLHGVPMGRVCEQLLVGSGVLMGMFHRLSKLFATVPEKLTEIYRQALVKHADETGWRTNGQNGYAWLFATPTLSIFSFEKTRSARVPRRVFGDQPLPGVLVVDRYASYNKMPCALQYCLAHLLREVQDAEKEFPESKEVRAFVSTVAPLLSLAMGLRGQPIDDATFVHRAQEVKTQLQGAMGSAAQHPAIRRIQDIFTDNAQRLYHWASRREVPADNNLAERDLRPTVIARKTSFGSVSDAGARTRGILMTVMHTLKKQAAYPSRLFKVALDGLANDSTADPFVLLFPALSPP